MGERSKEREREVEGKAYQNDAATCLSRHTQTLTFSLSFGLRKLVSKRTRDALPYKNENIILAKDACAVSARATKSGRFNNENAARK